LIVVDECHDESYFQDDFRPHYSAVETAITYARLANVPLMLGSATPTWSSYTGHAEKNGMNFGYRANSRPPTNDY